jgi:redox-sensitive bicupin YhaK (pirin superfamily)
MEILTWVIEGAIEHRDSMGHGSVVRPGELQHMSAGTGVTHSEFNHSKTDSLHLLQIWILPERRGIEPGYEQKSFSLDQHPGVLAPVASPDGRDGSIRIHQDVCLLAGRLRERDRWIHEIPPGRYAWLQIVRGAVTLNGTALEAGDGAAASGEPRLEVTSDSASELLLFDLP